jgi:FkbM family methyltransferase
MLQRLKSAAKRLLNRCGLVIRRTDNEQFFDFEALLWHRLHRANPFRFVQIGACDGVRFDPIHRFVVENHSRIRGLVVEPLPDLFAMLCQTYRPYPGITPVNCAIHNTAGTMTLHRVRPDRLGELPDWAVGITSFDPEHHRRLGIPDEAMTRVEVPCQTLTGLLAESGLNGLDLLQIDTEGYDAEIILGLDFSQIRPTVIRFEHGLGGGAISMATYRRVLDCLHGAGYEVIPIDSDAVAFQRSILEPPQNEPEVEAGAGR